MHSDLTDLRLFLHVAGAGSVTVGAAHSGLALAPASARVRDMEAQAGVVFLERDRRGVRPAPTGRALLHHARTVTRLDGQRRCQACHSNERMTTVLHE